VIGGNSSKYLAATASISEGRHRHPGVSEPVFVFILILSAGALVRFYSHQADSLPGWFAGGDVRHDRLRAVIAWLRTEWRPGPIWPTVLGRTASLIQGSAEIDAVPELLLELAAIARSFAGSEGAEQAAQHAHAALSWLGDQPSPARCRALRASAAAKLSLGQTDAALTLLVTAMNARPRAAQDHATRSQLDDVRIELVTAAAQPIYNGPAGVPR
jgi:hypothetical protein